MSDGGDIEYRVYDGSAPVDAAVVSDSLELFGDHRDQFLEDVIVNVLAQSNAERDTAITAAMAPLQREVAELRGQVITLLALLGGKGGDNVLDLPQLPMKGRVHVA